MKLFSVILCGAAMAVLASCGGVSNKHDKVKELKDKNEWTSDQTQEAIDIYIQGLNEQAAEVESSVDKIEDAYYLGEKLGLGYTLDYKGDKETLEKNSDKIKEAKQKVEDAEKKLEEATKALKEKLKDE